MRTFQALLYSCRRPAIGFLLILTAAAGTNAQCISEHCENGSGSTRLPAGVYTGSFRNGEPHGQGVFEGLRYSANARVDSVRDEGIFAGGIFLKGKHTIIHSWEEVEVPSSWYANKPRVWTGKAYRFESAYFTQDFGKTWDYPFYKTQKVTVTDGKGRSKTHNEDYIEFYEATYRGEIKNGLPNGKGQLTRSKFSFTGIFENGIPIAQTPDFYNIIESPINYPFVLNHTQLELRNMKFNDGLITELVIADKDSICTYTLQKPVSTFDFIYKGDYNGFYKMVDSRGYVYTGMINNWRFDGNGEYSYRGQVYTGSFKDQSFHGVGKLKGPSVTLDGLFIRGQFARGEIITNADNSRSAYPKCLTGNCQGGKGKVSYIVRSTADNYKTYEGYFSDGLPNGQGILVEKKGTVLTTVTGNFVQGMLNGAASYEGNAGIVTKMTGNFVNDTLKSGTVYYTDGSAFEFRTDLPAGVNVNSFVVFTSSVKEKVVNGFGKYYTPGGAVVEGTFYAGDRLLEGVYADKAGNRFRIGYAVNNDIITYDKLDWWGQRYAAQIKADEEARRQEAARYAAAQKRAAQYDEAEKNPANFREEKQIVPCSACNGKGYILSGYAVGSISYVSQEYMDNSGNWRRDLKGFVPAHNVTSRTPCEACHRRGTVLINVRKYVGPKF